MIHGLSIVFLGALPLIVANPLPKDSIDSDLLLSTYLDPIVLSLVPDLDNQGNLPSVDLGTSIPDLLKSITATYLAAIGSEASADGCENKELQPGVETSTKLRKQQESCFSQFKKSQPPTITPTKPILLPNPEEQLLNLPNGHTRTGGVGTHTEMEYIRRGETYRVETNMEWGSGN